MKWLLSDKENAHNLNNIARIRIVRWEDNYYLSGEQIHDKENDVFLSLAFKTEEEAQRLLETIIQ
jgi:hypothetical protein